MFHYSFHVWAQTFVIWAPLRKDNDIPAYSYRFSDLCVTLKILHFQIMEEFDLEEVCSDRRWNLHLCSFKDPGVVRDGFTKLSLHLLPSESENQRAPEKSPDPNRI